MNNQTAADGNSCFFIMTAFNECDLSEENGRVHLMSQITDDFDPVLLAMIYFLNYIVILVSSTLDGECPSNGYLKEKLTITSMDTQIFV